MAEERIPVFDPSVYGEAAYADNLIVPEVYGEIIAGSSTVAFTADAIIFRTQSASLTIDAAIAIRTTAGFSVDAFLQPAPPQLTQFTVAVFDPRVYGEAVYSDVLIPPETYGEALLEYPAEFIATASLDAVIHATRVGSFTADAIVRREQSASFTIDAVVSFPAVLIPFDAVIRKEQSASLTADAMLRALRSGSLTADAVVRKTVSGQATIDAVISPKPLEFVQQIGTANSKTANADLTITVPAGGVAAGAAIVVAVAYGAGNPASVLVSDSAGNTYHREYELGPGNVGLAVYACYGAEALTSGQTIVVEGTNLTADHAAVAVELSGVAGTSGADGFNTSHLGTLGATSTDTPSITGVNTTWDDEIIIGWFAFEGPAGDSWSATQSTIAGGGTTGAGAASNCSIRGAYRIESSRGTYATGGTNGNARNVIGVQIGFVGAVADDTSGPLYRDSTGNTGTGTSVTVTKPSGAEDGDLLVAVVTWANNAGTLNMQTDGAEGWTLAQRMMTTGNASQYEGEIWTKPSEPDDPASWTFTLSASPTDWQSSVVAYIDADLATPTEAPDYSRRNSSSATDMAATSDGGANHVEGRSTIQVASSKTRLLIVGAHSGSLTMFGPANFIARRVTSRTAVWDLGIPSPRTHGMMGWTSNTTFQSFLAAILAIRKNPTVSGSFTADAIVRKTQTASFTADAFIVSTAGEINGDFIADAIVRRERSASFAIDAVIMPRFAIDAVIMPRFVADAVIRRTQAASFTIDAEISVGGMGSLTADAVVRRTASASFTANAVIFKTVNPTLTADAIVRRSTTASFTADAVLVPRFFADAIIFRTQLGSFTVGAWIYSPRSDPDGPGGPGETPLVSIIVDGEDITADVVLADAQFTMLVNGAVGTCNLRVRDDAHERHFVSGSEITVDIDGKRRFGGYIMQPKRMYAFPAEDTSDPERPSRFHVLQGVDYNILMTKRVVYDKANPKNVELRHWPVDSHDDVVIRYVFDHYTDLAADGVTYNGVTHIASPNPDTSGVIASGGLRFVDAMREINRLISGVFYIDAYKDLNYVDVDTPNAQYGLSDDPGIAEIGYRELAQVENGASLTNDAMVWGTGRGARNMAFGRTEDAASIAAHGRWQRGEYTSTLYKQASVNLRADTMVNGTPQSKRGGKDNQESWTVTTFNNTFEAGQKVAIESAVFGKSDVLPIRRFTMTFPTKTKPKFELVLSHEIDEPWNLFEFWFPKIPPFPPIEVTVEDPPEPGACDCGIFDDFDDRTQSPGWGSNRAGYDWYTSFLSGADGSSVSGGSGHLSVSSAGGSNNNFARINPDPEWQLPLELLFHYLPANIPGGGQPELVVTPAETNINVRLSFNLALVRVGSNWETAGNAGDYGFSPLNQHNWVRIIIEPDLLQVRIWEYGTTEPGTWLINAARSGGLPPDFGWLQFLLGTTAAATDFNVAIDDIQVWADGVELTACTIVQFDDFNRVVASGWGMATPSGVLWTANGVISVQNGSGWLQPISDEVAEGRLETPPAFLDDPGGWTMTVAFMLDYVPSGAEDLDNIYFYLHNGSAICDMAVHADDGWFEVAGGTTFDTVPFTDWVADELYFVKWQQTYQAGTARAKIWRASEAEPDWMVTRDASSDTPGGLDDFIVGFQSFDALGSSLAITYIDFDYDDRPCYTNIVCGLTSWLGAYWEWAGGTGSGSETGGGWTISDTDPQLTLDNTGSGGANLVQFIIPNTATDFYDFLHGGGFHLTFEFYSPDSTWFTKWVFAVDAVPIDTVNMVDFTVGHNQWNVRVCDSTYTPPGNGTFNFGAGLHAMEIRCNAVSTSFYLDGALLRTIVQSIDLSTVSDLYVQFDCATNEVGTYAGMVELTRDDSTMAPWCAVDATIGGSGLPTGGTGRVDTTAPGSQPVFTIGQAYQLGSVRVFADGYFQRPGIEFTETDPETGEITFASAPDAGTMISIFYEVARV